MALFLLDLLVILPTGLSYAQIILPQFHPYLPYITFHPSIASICVRRTDKISVGCKH
jgi:hypothetical protein